MNTNTSIQNRVNAARQKLTDLTTASQTETEQAQAELRRLEAEAAKVTEAEGKRAAERGRIWATDYLANATERTEQRGELRTAERALRTALAAEPWVKALTDWHRARRRADLIQERETMARAYLDLPQLTPSAAPESAAHWHNGTPSPEFFLKPLLAVIDSTVDDELEAERETRDAELHSLLHAPDGKGDPLATLPKPRPGSKAHDPHRIEVSTRTAPDGTVIIAHRNLDNNNVEYTHENGEPYSPKTTSSDATSDD